MEVMTYSLYGKLSWQYNDAEDQVKCNFKTKEKHSFWHAFKTWSMADYQMTLFLMLNTTFCDIDREASIQFAVDSTTADELWRSLHSSRTYGNGPKISQ